MAMQIPEPDFYTLAEVAERWGRSEDVLFRLGAERKLILAWPIATGLSLYHDSGARIKSPWEETEGFEILERLQIWKRGGTGDDRNDIMPHGLALLDSRSIGPHSAISSGMILHPCFDCIDMTLNHEEAVNNSPLPGYSYRLRAVTPYHFRATVSIYISELVIPTSEIHRIEHQHEAAQKANAEDILGTRERETMQAVIAAMTQLIAGTATKYKRNERPNVDAISVELEKAIPDRTKRGISETISRALKAGLIRT